MASEKSLDYRVMEIFADVLGLDGKLDIEPQSMIRGELGVDSMDLLGICAEIEQEFDVEVEANAADKWVTVGDVIRYVRSKVPVTFTQADVDAIVSRAKELGAGPGLTHKQDHLQLSSYGKPHGPEALAMLLINGWDGKYDLIYATQALIEFLLQRKDS